ncbi:MAG: P-loop NTPase [Candidatus Coatesbacteria bacterium]|nr:P-loop NTPase [Candidatus Coatesbacteria bacterium]
MSDRKQCHECSSDQPPDRANNQHIKAELEDRQAIADRLSNVEHKFLVLSGKGGVGKSTVAANLAVFLSRRGKKVGLLDIDIHGPSIPKLLHLEEAKPQGFENTILPITFSDNLRVMSIGFLLERSDDAVIWRGPMKYGVIKQFLKDVAWGDLDYLIVDSPPGTGDEPLSIAQLIQRPDGAIIVTTPQDLSVIDVRKCISFCKKLHLPVLGIIENMSGFVCPKCGEKVNIFKAGGGAKMAKDLHVPYLGSLPIDPAVVAASDAGRALLDEAKDSLAAAAFEQIAQSILDMTMERKPSLGDAPWEPSKHEIEVQKEKAMETNQESRVRVAIPTSGGKLAGHFGRCEQFTIYDVDTANRRITATESIPAPPHEPGLLPGWLRERDVQVVIAGGMGPRAKGLFDEQDIEVIIGAPTDDPQALVSAYAAGRLESGENVCDH